MPESGLSWEQWGDLVTLGTFGFMFWLMLFFSLRRTWKWDALGRALTVLVGALGVLFTLGFAAVFNEGLRPFYVRWPSRIVGTLAAVVVIVVLALDDPERGVNEQLRWLAARALRRVRHPRTRTDSYRS